MIILIFHLIFQLIPFDASSENFIKLFNRSKFGESKKMKQFRITFIQSIDYIYKVDYKDNLKHNNK